MEHVTNYVNYEISDNIIFVTINTYYLSILLQNNILNAIMSHPIGFIKPAYIDIWYGPKQVS